MLNEGLIVNDTTGLAKSAIVNQIRRLGPTTPDALKRAAFKDLTVHDREEVDWEEKDNQAGYYTWVKSLDRLIAELVDDGCVLVEEPGRLMPTEAEPQDGYAHLVYPKRR